LACFPRRDSLPLCARRAARYMPAFPAPNDTGPAQMTLAITASDEPADGGGGLGTGVGVATKAKPKTAKPNLYKVLMLNDDYTPMEFVVLTLQRFFRMSIEDATRVMLHVHQRGVGVCGIFTYEVAETKVNQVIDFAREHQHPLQCTMEKD
jgi:ATP-dependent Clp protease adaptor protein ClpS